jgi:hypothetical protein
MGPARVLTSKGIYIACRGEAPGLDRHVLRTEKSVLFTSRGRPGGDRLDGLAWAGGPRATRGDRARRRIPARQRQRGPVLEPHPRGFVITTGPAAPLLHRAPRTPLGRRWCRASTPWPAWPRACPRSRGKRPPPGDGQDAVDFALARGPGAAVGDGTKAARGGRRLSPPPSFSRAGSACGTVEPRAWITSCPGTAPRSTTPALVLTSPPSPSHHLRPDVPAAEVAYAVTHEGALHLEDIQPPRPARPDPPRRGVGAWT